MCNLVTLHDTAQDALASKDLKGKIMEEFGFWVELTETITIKRRIPASMTGRTREEALEKIWDRAEAGLLDDELLYEEAEVIDEETTYEVI